METQKKVSIIYEFKPHLVAGIFNFEISNNYEPKLRKAVSFGN